MTLLGILGIDLAFEVSAGGVDAYTVVSALLFALVLGLVFMATRSLEREARERRETERALEESRQRLQDILENSTNLFYSHALDHRITYVSPQTRTFLGCEPEEALRRWTEFVTDNPINRIGLERTEVAVRTGERQPVYELELQRTDGRKLWVEVNEAPVVRDGKTVAVVGALTDVTAQKLAAEERRRLEERLRLGQRLEAVGRLAGGVAHDFNNFLTAILGYCDLLALRLKKNHPLQSEVAQIRRAGRRAASLIDQLLAFSRRQVITPRVLDLSRAVADATGLVQRLIGEDVELVARLGDEPLWVEADPSQLEQVLVNLAANARDAMPTGGRLTVETGSCRLETARPGDLFEVEPGPYCLLRVTDSGEGMDAETLDHLFEPFYTTKELGRGTGLGLSTVYGIVKQNRGYIWVDSQRREGACFSVYLPMAEAPAEVEPAAARAPARARGEGTILLVEDEPLVRSLIHEVLVGQGYQVLDAADAAAALHRSSGHQGPVDLVLTDVVMPGMPGDTMARRLLADRPEAAVLYISGYSECTLTQRGVLPEGERLLQKPFTPEELIAAVADALAERDLERRSAAPPVVAG